MEQITPPISSILRGFSPFYQVDRDGAADNRGIP